MSQTQTRRSSQVDLLHGPILKSLLLFALPIMASRVFQQIYNTMDTLIVGYTLGDSSIAAMGACSSIYEMMTGFTFGVGNGLAIVTARCFGRQETDRMKKSVASCIVMMPQPVWAQDRRDRSSRRKLVRKHVGPTPSSEVCRPIRWHLPIRVVRC